MPKEQLDAASSRRRMLVADGKQELGLLVQAMEQRLQWNSWEAKMCLRSIRWQTPFCTNDNKQNQAADN